jgi:hypothetical protein
MGGSSAVEPGVNSCSTLRSQQSPPILASSHDETLRPIIRELDGHLADLLTPYVGSYQTALVVASAIQGLILTDLATGGSSDDSLHDAVANLVRRFAAPSH